MTETRPSAKTEAVDPIDHLSGVVDHFTQTLDGSAQWSQLRKERGSCLWRRERVHRSHSSSTVLHRLTSQLQDQPPQNEPVPEHRRIVGEGLVSVDQHVTLTQVEYRDRRLISGRPAKLFGTSWTFLHEYTSPTNSALEVRGLTEEELQQGYGRPVLTTPAATHLTLGHTIIEGWYIADAAPLSPKLNPQSQIGRIVLEHLHQAALTYIPDTMAIPDVPATQ